MVGVLLARAPAIGVGPTERRETGLGVESPSEIGHRAEIGDPRPAPPQFGHRGAHRRLGDAAPAPGWVRGDAADPAETHGAPVERHRPLEEQHPPDEFVADVGERVADPIGVAAVAVGLLLPLRLGLLRIAEGGRQEAIERRVPRRIEFVVDRDRQR